MSDLTEIKSEYTIIRSVDKSVLNNYYYSLI